MRQFVDERDAWATRQHGVEIHLVEDSSAIHLLAARNLLETIGESRGCRAPVRLDNRDHHIYTLIGETLCMREHFVGLADSGRTPEEDFKSSPGVST